jgi:hypothetical protein
MGDSDEHMEKTAKQQSVLRGQSGYQGNCSSGFRESGYCQIHHILSLTCIGKRAQDYKSADAQYIEDCLWCTPWNVNDGHNLIGLPLNKKYIDSNGTAPVNLPSHQVDHNTLQGYTFEVSRWLKGNVWDKITAKTKIHKVDVQKVQDLLKAGSDHWRNQLENVRGHRKPGTVEGWQKRFEPAMKKKWYIPFSMALMVSERSPGKSPTDLTEIFKNLS